MCLTLATRQLGNRAIVQIKSDHIKPIQSNSPHEQTSSHNHASDVRLYQEDDVRVLKRVCPYPYAYPQGHTIGSLSLQARKLRLMKKATWVNLKAKCARETKSREKKTLFAQQ